MLELAVASSAPAGGDEPARRRLVRDYLASKEGDLGCVEAPRADYEVAAARHPEWARAQEGWALDDDMLELRISRLENGKFRVEWRPSSPPLSPEELSTDLEEIMGRESPGMLVRRLIRTAAVALLLTTPRIRVITGDVAHRRQGGGRRVARRARGEPAAQVGEAGARGHRARRGRVRACAGRR